MCGKAMAWKWLEGMVGGDGLGGGWSWQAVLDGDGE